MTDKNSKKQSGVSSTVAAGIGAVVGAGVVAAGVAGAFLQNKDNREKVKGALSEAKDKATEIAGDIKNKVQDSHE